MNEYLEKEHLILYTTLGCHLCEQALDIFEATLNPAFFEVELVDIADYEGLIEAYGTRIPVLKRVKLNRELNWPFSPQQLVDFLSR